MGKADNGSIPYENLRMLFNEKITVAEIAEPFLTCSPHDRVEAVYAKLDRLHFEAVGVEEEGTVTSYVLKEDLRNARQIKDVSRLFSPKDFIVASTPLLELFTILRDRRSIFVLGANHSVHIITRTDLQKIPVRMLLFGLVSLIEMHMLRLIRENHPDAEWKGLLPVHRLEKAMDMMKTRQERNEAIDLGDCLQFSDKKEIILNSSLLKKMLGIPSKKKGASLFNKIEALRDKLAHAQDLVTGTTWSDIFNTIRESESLLERMEQL